MNAPESPARVTNASCYIEVACKGDPEHVYTIAAPLEENVATRELEPVVPRFCYWCRPPEKTNDNGIATDRKANVAGGIFIGSWRPTALDDHHQPVRDPKPVRAA
jgi:hypothetical protein